MTLARPRATGLRAVALERPGAVAPASRRGPRAGAPLRPLDPPSPPAARCRCRSSRLRGLGSSSGVPGQPAPRARRPDPSNLGPWGSPPAPGAPRPLPGAITLLPLPAHPSGSCSGCPPSGPQGCEKGGAPPKPPKGFGRGRGCWIGFKDRVNRWQRNRVCKVFEQNIC